MAAETTTTKVSFDHVALSCPADIFEEEIRFLSAALAPLGIKEHHRPVPLLVGLGDNPGRSLFWISGLENGEPRKDAVTRSHVAFKARDRTQAEEFHKAGIAAGGKDYGAPGLKDNFGSGYYAAFIISPAGHNIEAVFRDPELTNVL